MSLGPGRGSDSAVRVRLQELKNKLCCLIDNTDEIESLLTSILSTLQSGTEYEAKIVVDNCDSGKLYLEVRVYDTDSGTWGPTTYYTPGSSTPVVPIGLGSDCLQYSDPSSLLSQILTEIQNGIDVNISAPIGQDTMSASVSVTLASDQQGIERTPGIIRTSTAGDVNTAAALFFSVSVANVGAADGTVLGQGIKPGEILNFSADAVNNYFTSFAYDATGTEFIIIFVS
jgi:hypothetical protein